MCTDATNWTFFLKNAPKCALQDCSCAICFAWAANGSRASSAWPTVINAIGVPTTNCSAVRPGAARTCFYIYIAIDIKSDLAPPDSRPAQGGTPAQQSGTRTNEPAPAIVVIQSHPRHRSIGGRCPPYAPIAIEINLRWWAVPTLRSCGWLRYGLRMRPNRSHKGGHRPPNR